MSKKVILTYNLIHEEEYYDKPVDTMAELDTEEIIEAVKNAIESAGHRVRLVEADEQAYEKLKSYRTETDIIFNLAEGTRGESRESHIPCMAEMLGIPYVGSGPLTLAVALNKYRTKEILVYHGIPTPRFQVFHPFDPGLKTLNRQLNFPLIVKLSCEGSSIGLNYDSIVETEKALADKMEYLFNTYYEPVLVEEFVGGREFTIPVIGNDPPVTLPVIEVQFFGEKPINVFYPDKDLEIFKKLKYTPHEQKTRAVCPAEITEALKDQINRIALKVYRVLECRDWCRMEIRLDREENPFVLELNPIAGIAPGYWFPRSAEAAGIGYNALINRILEAALERYALNKKRKAFV